MTHKNILNIENKILDTPDLNRFRIGDEVVADACADHDRFEGVIIGLEFQRVHGTKTLKPSITLLHDVDQITDGFVPGDLRLVHPRPQLETRPAAFEVLDHVHGTFVTRSEEAARKTEFPYNGLYRRQGAIQP